MEIAQRNDRFLFYHCYFFTAIVAFARSSNQAYACAYALMRLMSDPFSLHISAVILPLVLVNAHVASETQALQGLQCVVGLR